MHPLAETTLHAERTVIERVEPVKLIALGMSLAKAANGADSTLHLPWRRELTLSANQLEASMAQCECGCGEESTREFLPGHDQKLRTSLEARVGGILALRSLVVSAEAYAEGSKNEVQFQQGVRAVFSAKWRS